MLSLSSRRRRVLLGLAAGLVALAALGMWLRSSSLVRVQAVTVTGVEGRQADEIRDRLKVAALDMTTLAIDREELRRAVESYPVVRSLRTSTDFPHRLRITINAYEPVAALRRGGTLMAVAADGTLLRGTATQELPSVGVKALPDGGRTTDPQTLRAISLVAAAPAPLRRRVDSVSRGTRGLAAAVHEGPKLYFGADERLAAKWAAAAQVLASERAQGASYVDLRIPERPVAGGFQPRPQISVSTLG